MITVIYLVHNRLFYTKMSLPLVLEEVKSDLVTEFIIFDDMSTKDTVKYINSLKIKKRLGNKYKLIRRKFGNTTDQINYCILNSKNRYLYKIDNDILIPKGSIETMHKVISSDKDTAFLMMKEVSDKPFINKLDTRKASHIGGVGIFRLDLMRRFGTINPSARFFGFTEYQVKLMNKYKKVAKFLKHCGNTNLDMSKFTKVKKFTKLGYSRDTTSNKPGSIYREY